MSIDNLSGIGALKDLNSSATKNITNTSNNIDKLKNAINGEAGKVDTGNSFKDMLQGFVGDVNKMQLQADEQVNKLAAGEVTDVHDVMVKVEEANLSFSLMMEIRNKIVEGYKEVIKTQI